MKRGKKILKTKLFGWFSIIDPTSGGNGAKRKKLLNVLNAIKDGKPICLLFEL